MEYIVNVPYVSGANGAAIGSADTEGRVYGFVEAVSVVYSNAPGTTTVTLVERDGTARTILTLSAGNTNVIKYPSIQRTDTSGTAIASIYGRIYVPGRFLTAAFASGNTNTALVLRILTSEY